MRRGDILRILSPLAFFLGHVVYLAAWSPDPFLKKWIDGSFTFFIALVLCNVIRARVVAAAHPGDEKQDKGPASDNSDEETGT